MFDIADRRRYVHPSLVERYRSIAPATLGHLLDHGIVDSRVQCLQPRARVVGPAITVQTYGRDSTACHKVFDFVRPGDVIVVDRGGERRYACWGEMTSIAAKVREVAGVVVDGPVTDVASIREMQLPVFCRGTSVVTTQLLGQHGGINVPVACGGVVVHPGDLVLGDENGLIVIPLDQAEMWLDAAYKEQTAEEPYRQALLEGRLPSELAPIDDLIRKAEQGLP